MQGGKIRELRNKITRKASLRAFLRDALSNLLSRQRRELNMLSKQAAKIEELEDEFAALDDVALLKRGHSLRDEYQIGMPMEALMVEAFAAVREAVRRTLGIKARDVQLMGAVAMQTGAIAEMATGEGKSIAVLFPAFLQGLSGKGVHVATLNAYLAERDHAQATAILSKLGSSCGLVRAGETPASRRRGYDADITFAAYQEFAQDYLKDSMQLSSADTVQRGHTFILIDEIDAILIDEGRTPITISEPHPAIETIFHSIALIVSELGDASVEIDRKMHTVFLTESGHDEIEALLREHKLIAHDTTLSDVENINIAHHFFQSLKAKHLYRRDHDYVVLADKVVLLDRVTGRSMPSSRFGDGLHQAIEAKEGLALSPEMRVLSSISIQNYIRLYGQRAGMTATAAGNAEEFYNAFGLEIRSIPPWQPSRRIDLPDEIYQTRSEKIEVICRHVQQANVRHQPVLVGTTNIADAEEICAKLEQHSIECALLTAKHDADEANLIARAGEPGAVTIAANMAGRGTDIQLGGAALPLNATDEERLTLDFRRELVVNAGGLLVIGAGKHDSSRMDHQLRGRAGRQGDVGSSIFIQSLEDDLFASILEERPDFFKSRSLEVHSNLQWARGFLKRHQMNVERRHAQARAMLVRFDDVLHEQRRAIFAERLRLMQTEDLSQVISAMRDQVADDLINQFMPKDSLDGLWDLSGFAAACDVLFSLNRDQLRRLRELVTLPSPDRQEIGEFIKNAASAVVEDQKQSFGGQMFKSVQMQVILNAIDMAWQEHERMMEGLRAVVGFRAYGKRDPLVEYQTEGFEHFEQMLERLRYDVTKNQSRLRALDANQQISAIEGVLFG